MFKNLKISNIKALKECRLQDLGKINIICGKNNSGKSTLLEGIHKKESRSKAIIVSEADIVFFYEETIENTAWRGNRTHYNNEYLQILRNALKEKSFLCENELEKTLSVIAEKMNQNGYLSNYRIHGPSCEKAFKNLFKGEHDTVFIPPKRILELKKGINFSEGVEPTGEKILNYLFYAKNQDYNSEHFKLFKKLNEALYNISAGYSFDIFIMSDKGGGNSLVLNFSFKDGAWVNASDCGLGLQELIIILFFAIYPKYNVILIEEPESHLHPDMQKKLLNFLKNTDKQFFITTHSNVFLNNALVDKVFFTYFNGEVKVDDATSRASILDDLGYSVTENLVSDLIILVEGPTDTPIIEEFLIKMNLYEKYDIKIWPLGGDIMHKLDLSVFAQNYSIISLIDSDPGSRRIRKRFVDNCKLLNIHVHKLKRYAIENYFTVRALKDVFGGQIKDAFTVINPDVKLEDQIGIDVKKNNRKLAQQMTMEEIEGTDLYKFFKKVEDICKNSKNNFFNPAPKINQLVPVN